MSYRGRSVPFYQTIGILAIAAQAIIIYGAVSAIRQANGHHVSTFAAACQLLTILVAFMVAYDVLMAYYCAFKRASYQYLRAQLLLRKKHIGRILPLALVSWWILTFPAQLFIYEE